MPKNWTEDEVKNEANKKILEENAQAYKRLFMSADGKKVMKDLELFCNFRNSSVCEQQPNAMQTMFNEGKRRVILRIKQMTKKVERKE